MPHIERLLNAGRPYLTDGGLETWLFFQQCFEAPEFAAITLVRDDAAQSAMKRYFSGFLALAESAGTGFVLDTATWRGCPEWAPKLGLTADELLELNRDAVQFADVLRHEWSDRVSDIVLDGVIGPAGDGYAPGSIPAADEAEHLHSAQVGVLAEGGVDMISAVTMTNVPEAIGITRAATALGLPVAVSFTVETDGRLPSGQSLGGAIIDVDEATSCAPVYYMINCAHPDHFADRLDGNTDWISRIGGVRANASRLSHAELDVAEELDDGDPEEFGALYADLARRIPALRVVGGCCGTDHRHVRCVTDHLHGRHGM